MEHAHHAWLSAIAEEINSEYWQVRRKLEGPENTQQRGHHYEALFRRMLLRWLPPQYEIGTRKYLLLEHGVDGEIYSKETDLVIFHPSYPRELRERSEVLLAGVVAAFSVKSALDAQVLQDAIAEARLVRDGFIGREGSIVGELVSPLIYGVLTHTHNLSGSEPRAVVTDVLLGEANNERVPRRQLDLVCIADLDCWYRTADCLQYEIGSPNPSDHDKYIDYWHSAYHSPEFDPQPVDNPNPVATLVTQLWAKLATRDPQLAYLARGLEVTGTGSHGGVGHPRPLTEIVSTALHRRLFLQGSRCHIV
jgi:hypothetical protein